MSRGDRRRTLSRVREIAQVATRYGFGYIFRRGLSRPDPDSEAPDARATRGRRLREMLDILLSHSKVSVRVQEDPARLRPSDVPILWADVSKFQRATGWAPTIPFERTLADLLDHWRARVASGKLLPLGQMPSEVPVGRE